MWQKKIKQTWLSAPLSLYCSYNSWSQKTKSEDSFYGIHLNPQNDGVVLPGLCVQRHEASDCPFWAACGHWLGDGRWGCTVGGGGGESGMVGEDAQLMVPPKSQELSKEQFPKENLSSKEKTHFKKRPKDKILSIWSYRNRWPFHSSVIDVCSPLPTVLQTNPLPWISKPSWHEPLLQEYLVYHFFLKYHLM